QSTIMTKLRILVVTITLLGTYENARAQNTQGVIQFLSRTNTGSGATFQETGPATADSYLHYLETLPDFTTFTICFRLLILQYREHDQIISYALPDYDDELALYYDMEENQFVLHCCDGTLEISWTIDLPLQMWQSLCLAVDLKVRFWQLILNGKIINNYSIEEDDDPQLVRGQGNLYIGIDQDSYGGSFNIYESLRGDLLDLRIFDYTMTSGTMINFTSCDTWTSQNPPIIDFEEHILQKFEIKGVIVSNITDDEGFCSGPLSFDIIIPERLQQDQGQRLCISLGGSMKVPTNELDNSELLDQVMPNMDYCSNDRQGALWLGVMGNATDKRWYETYTGIPITYDKFNKDVNIDWDELDDLCVEFSGIQRGPELGYGKWYQGDCDEEYCIPCQFSATDALRVRGLCETSLFDRRYIVTEYEGKVSFMGSHYSQIIEVPKINGSDGDGFGFWKMYRFDMPEVYAILEIHSPTHFPVGFNIWKVENDECGFEEMPLTITSCSTDQFTCRDGSCEKAEDRCDTEFHCLDESDEIDCDPIVLPPTYDNESPPPRPGPNTPLEVALYAKFLAIPSFELDEFKFSSEVEIRLSWKDMRLDYKNLQIDDFLNNINLKQDKPWTPELDILSGDLAFSKVEENIYQLYVKRQTPPLPDNDENYKEDDVFDSAKSLLVLIRQLTVQSECQFDLFLFPFDTQTCYMVIFLNGQMKKYLTLVAEGDGVTYLGNTKLKEYQIASSRMNTFDRFNYSGLAVEFKFHNMYTFYITNTYIPTLILLSIGYCTFFFPIHDFNDRIMVALTSLLVEAAFFTQTSASIPKTAYLKFVDIWFVFCIIFMFLITVLLVIINKLHEDEKTGKLTHISPASSSSIVKVHQVFNPAYVNKLAMFGIPTLVIIFMIGYFFSAFMM
ncbi:unnamed protein product, partial [Meganyctiphanes norvegica]